MGLEAFIAFVIAFVATALFTPAVRRFAWRQQVLDYPDSARKFHKYPLPELGGFAVFSGFAFTLLLLRGVFPDLFGAFIKTSYIFGLLAAGVVLMIGGYLDDRYRISPAKQFAFPVLAILIVIFSGVQLSYINSPFGGAIILDSLKIWGYPLFGGLFIFLWILGMVYTTKFLDGLDGLVAGISGIAGLVIYFLSLLPQVQQPDTALLAIIFAGSALGFLPWNFYPAKIFLGESGSTFTGFMIGLLSIISGGKIATALLIMGIPILDAAWVIIRRLAGHTSPFLGDRRHLHFRLLDWGLSHRQAVILLYFFSAAFGVSGLFLQTTGKLVAFGILAVVMVILGTTIVLGFRRKQEAEKHLGTKLF